MGKDGLPGGPLEAQVGRHAGHEVPGLVVDQEMEVAEAPMQDRSKELPRH